MTGPTAFRDWLQPLEIVLRLDGAFDRGVLTFRSRAAAAPVADLDLDALIDAGEASRFVLTRGALEDAARAVILRYVDGLKNYERGAALVAIEAGLEDGIAEADTPLVLDKDRATVHAETILRSSAASRERIALALPPSAEAIRPGSLFSLDLPEVGPQRFLVEKVERGETIKVEATIYAPGAFALSGGVTRAPTVFVEPGSSTVLVAFLDLPILPGTAAPDWTGYVAGHASPWPGGFDLYRSVEQSADYTLNARGGLRATIGETLTALDPGRLWSWSSETVEVRLFAGSLVSRSDRAVLAGANALAVEHSPGAWEVLQFANADLIGDRTWRLSRLLRGQCGTEGVRSTSPLGAGARVVLLDLAVLPVKLTAAEARRPFWWRYGPAGKNPEARGYRTRAHTFAAVGRRPFAPVHLTARADGGDVAIGWIRRTRIEGDPWPDDDGDVPLGETVERYRVEVRVGAALVRGWTVTGATSTTYTAAQQAADAIAAPFTVRVQQVSETYGRGAPAEAEFTG
jgi:hypothetical protein